MQSFLDFLRAKPWVLAASLVAIGTAIAAADNPEPAPLMNSVSVTDARNLLTGAGAVVESVDYSTDGFTLKATLSPERHIWFDGMNCKGRDQAMACTEFKISAKWQLDTAAHADAIAKQLNYNYTSVFADGAELDLWRMDFTYGGLPRDHLRLTLGEFLQLRQQAEDVIWPRGQSSEPAQPDQK